MIVTTRIITLVAATALAVVSCAPMAVQAPYKEARRGSPVETGRSVRIVTVAGASIEGRVEVVDEGGFVVAGTRVGRGEIAQMWMEPQIRPVLTPVVVFCAGALAVIGIAAALRSGPAPRPDPVPDPPN